MSQNYKCFYQWRYLSFYKFWNIFANLKNACLHNTALTLEACLQLHLLKWDSIVWLNALVTRWLSWTQKFPIKVMVLWGFQPTPPLGESANSRSVPVSDPIPLSLFHQAGRLQYPTQVGTWFLGQNLVHCLVRERQKPCPPWHSQPLPSSAPLGV